MPFKIVRNDITKMKVDAVVNAANTELRMGGGVCGAIFEAAGAEKLQEECRRIGHCGVGEAVITHGFGLPAKYIIHTVGPVWHGGSHGEAKLLHDSYIRSLKLALQYKCRSVAFPLISSGIFGYPRDQALHIAVSAISEFLLEHELEVYLVVFDKKSFVMGEKLFSDIERYIDDNYADGHLQNERSGRMVLYEERFLRSAADDEQLYDAEDIAPAPDEDMLKTLKRPGRYQRHKISERQKVYEGQETQGSARRLEDAVRNLDDSFSQMLLRLIDEKGMTDVETYKRANIDRRLFSKIRSNIDYQPSKATAIALAIALRLNLDETLDLLARAGYTLSHSNKSDIIIEYFIKQGNYNIFEINEALFAFDQDLLGA